MFPHALHPFSLLLLQPKRNRKRFLTPTRNTQLPILMAVEAHHLHLFPSQLIRNREIINDLESQGSVYNTHMGFVAPVSGAGSFVPFYNPGASMAATTTTAAASESGLTFNELSSVSRKRSRGSASALSFLGEDVSSRVQQQQLDIDCLIAHQVEKMRLELLERRKQFSSQILAAVEARVSRRIRAKEEEIERMGKLNWALEERVRSLCVENQIWRDLAQSNEAAANMLRSNLEQVLAAQQVRVKEEQQSGEAMEDAESCCGGGDRDKEEEEEKGWVMKRACRRCQLHEPSVLLLPCRHLCVCAACGPEISACPICKCGKKGSVNVNLS